MMPPNHVSETTNLHMDVITDSIIDTNIKFLELGEVSNPINFERGRIPTIDGLFSEAIFGVSTEERRLKWGYIDLKTKVIHPFIYNVLCGVQQNIAKICRGEGSWKVDDKHNLVEVKPNSDEYDENNTGIDWFVKHYSEIVFRKNKSRERSEKIDLLNTFKPNEIFISKWLVIPVFYRDVESKDGPLKIPPINNEYQKLIRFSQSINGEGLNFMRDMENAAKFNIQITLVAIMKYYQEIIQKSDGFFKQYVIGKNPDYGVRSVISCAVLTQYDTPDDSPIDMNCTGFPLSEVVTMLFPFIKRWIYNWFLNTFESAGNKKIVYNKYKDAKTKDKVLTAIDVMSKYTPEYIQKKIDGWIDNYESRFELITIDAEDEDGKIYKDVPIIFTGIPYAGDRENPNASDSATRPMTWTDLLYIAAEECSEDKYAWVTRYPLTSYLGTFPTKIHVLSTVRTAPYKMIVNGDERIYKYYPIIDVNKSTLEVSISFNETVNMANLMLETIGGDYDGDTISTKAVYSTEANQEIIDLLYDPKHFLDCKGQLLAVICNEGVLTLYNMTKD